MQTSVSAGKKGHPGKSVFTIPAALTNFKDNINKLQNIEQAFLTVEKKKTNLTYYIGYQIHIIRLT